MKNISCIELKNICYEVGDRIIFKNFSQTFERGKIYCIVGTLLSVFMVHFIFQKNGMADYIIGNAVFVRLRNVSFELFLLHFSVMLLLPQYVLHLKCSARQVYSRRLLYR